MKELFYILTIPAYNFWIRRITKQNLTERDWQSIYDYEDKKCEAELAKDYLADKVDGYIQQALSKQI